MNVQEVNSRKRAVQYFRPIKRANEKDAMVGGRKSGFWTAGRRCCLKLPLRQEWRVRVCTF